MTIQDIRQLTSQFGFEAINAILMGKRMGVLGKNAANANPVARRFMDAVDQMFKASNRMTFNEFPFWKWFETASKKEHHQAWDDIFRIGGEIFAQSRVNRDPVFATDGITDFFDIMDQDVDSARGSQPTMNKEEQTVMGIELIAAGVDTTSNAAQWIILYMAQNPAVQQRLAGVLRQVMGPLGLPTAVSLAHIDEAKLLAFVDEVLRIHPVLPTNSRLFTKDVEIAGYNIPAGTFIKLNNFTASRDARFFKEPEKFDETRVARRECPFGSKTFGAGARQCKWLN
jgi:cytochrome P450 family 12